MLEKIQAMEDCPIALKDVADAGYCSGREEN
jgi:hypothetical protein